MQENQPRMLLTDREQLLLRNREKYGAPVVQNVSTTPRVEFETKPHEIL
jgi:hypothetical protein